jgi:hypothetical protein
MVRKEVNTENKIVACRLNDTGNCPFLGFVLLGKQKNEPGFGMESRLNKSLTEYRWSGAPGDLLGASFLYFLWEKVLRTFRGCLRVRGVSLDYCRIHISQAQLYTSGAHRSASCRRKKRITLHHL